MPTYEYRCQKCGKIFEVFQKMSDKPISRCPDKKCMGRVTRLIGAGSGFIFRGPGFYATDYRKDSHKEKEKQETPKTATPCQSCEDKEGCSAA